MAEDGTVAGAATVAAIAVTACAFALSQAFRTLPTIVAPGIMSEMAAGPAELGLIGMTFHLAFAALQIPFGFAIDRFGPRIPVILALLVAAFGALIAASAATVSMLGVAQALMGAGCAPTLVAAMWILSHNRDSSRFAALTGMVMTLGSAGILVTSLPFAWLVDATGWRFAFAILGCLSLAAAVAAAVLPGRSAARSVEDRRRAAMRSILVKGYPGLLVMAFVGYSSVLTFRALWVVPFLADRHGLSLDQAASVTLAFSMAIAVSPAVIGWLNARSFLSIRAIIAATGGSIGVLYGLLAASAGAGLAFDAVLILALGTISAVPLLVFASIQARLPSGISGRALSIANLAVFSGVAFSQWMTGVVGNLAEATGYRPYEAILAALAALALTGTAVFLLLPGIGEADSGHAP